MESWALAWLTEGNMTYLAFWSSEAWLTVVYLQLRNDSYLPSFSSEEKNDYNFMPWNFELCDSELLVRAALLMS